jgi:hypothetical protein
MTFKTNLEGTKMKNEFTTAQLAEINALQEKHNLTRKVAIQKFIKSGKKISLTAGEPKNEVVVASEPTDLTAPAPVVAAEPVEPNADSEIYPKPLLQVSGPSPVTAEAPKPEAPKQAASKPKPEPKPQTAAGAARAEGIRLFKLAGKPGKQDFIHVYGPMGHKWTWVARAKAVGLSTAEEAAQQFQDMRTKPAGSCVIPDKPKEEAKATPDKEQK